MSQTVNGFFPWDRTNNPLLKKESVGRGKPSSYSLPPKHYTYGKPLERDEEGAREVSMTWKYHDETRAKEPDRDFAKLNKLSLTQGLHKSNEFSAYRRSTDARLKVQKGKNALPLYIPGDDFSYGQPNRPSTPIKFVVGNSYGVEYSQRLEVEYMRRTQMDSFRPRLLPRGNKASDLSYTYNKMKLSEKNQPTEKELFKLTKFKKVTPRTNTHVNRNGTEVGKSSRASAAIAAKLVNNDELPNQAVD